MEEKGKPIIETKITKSKDGKWVIHKTIITDIKSANYYKAILEGQLKIEEETI
jgi:hypothetical protein